MFQTKLADYIYTFTDDSILKDESHSSIIFTKKGPIVIDTFGTEKQYQSVRDFLKEKGYVAPYMVIYTHGHFDHMLGNQDMNPNYPVIAQIETNGVIHETKERMFQRLVDGGYISQDTMILYPTITFKEEMKITIDDVSLLLIHTPFHTRDSITVIEENAKLAFTGDNFNLIENKVYVPNLDLNKDPKERQFINALEKVLRYEPELFIQGHGKAFNPVDFYQVIREYSNQLETYCRNNPSLDIESITPQDVLTENLIDKIFDINGSYSTFQNNLKNCILYKKNGN